MINLNKIFKKLSILNSFTILIICFTNSFAFGQWTLLGHDIEGDNAVDYAGTVSVSGDGLTAAIGASGNDFGGPNAGQVKVFKYIPLAEIWLQHGSTIHGGAVSEYAGSAVNLSADGSTLAIGYPGNSNNGFSAGKVSIYKFISNEWVQIGSSLYGDTVYDRFGRSMELSSDGATIAIGAPANQSTPTSPGYAKVYSLDQGNWLQVGSTLVGDSVGDRFGEAISLSDDGQMLAIGASTNNYISTFSGQTKVFKLEQGNWNQAGSTLYGSNYHDLFGTSVSINADGSILAVGATSNDNGNFLGHTKIYEYVAGNWSQIGSTIYGSTNSEYSSKYISLSSDGSTIAISAYLYDGAFGSGYDCGTVRVYKNEFGVWNQIGPNIDGEEGGDQSGTVSLSADGSKVAIGARYHNVNGSSNVGHVRVFKFEGPVGIPENTFGNSFICQPNPTKNETTIELGRTYNDLSILVTNSIGQIFSENNYASVERINLNIDGESGIYFITIRSNNQEKVIKLIKN